MRQQYRCSISRWPLQDLYHSIAVYTTWYIWAWQVSPGRATGQPQSATGNATIRIGVSWPRASNSCADGSLTELGDCFWCDDARQGLRYWRDVVMHNESGFGINVELEELEDNGDGSMIQANYQGLAQNCTFLIGPYKQELELQISEIAQNHDVILILWAFDAETYIAASSLARLSTAIDSSRRLETYASSRMSTLGPQVQATPVAAEHEDSRDADQGTYNDHAGKSTMPSVDSSTRGRALSVASIANNTHTIDINIPMGYWGTSVIEAVRNRVNPQRWLFTWFQDQSGEAAQHCINYRNSMENVTWAYSYEMRKDGGDIAFDILVMRRLDPEAVFLCGGLSSMVSFVSAAKAFGLEVAVIMSDRPLGPMLTQVLQARNTNYIIESVPLTPYYYSRPCPVFGSYANFAEGFPAQACQVQDEPAVFGSMPLASVQTAAAGVLITQFLLDGNGQGSADAWAYLTSGTKISTFIGSMQFDQDGTRIDVEPGMKQFVHRTGGNVIERYLSNDLKEISDDAYGDCFTSADVGTCLTQFANSLNLPELTWSEKELAIYPCHVGCHFNESLRVCQACGPGWYRSFKLVECQACPQGYYASDDASERCIRCPVGATCSDSLMPLADPGYYNLATHNLTQSVAPPAAGCATSLTTIYRMLPCRPSRLCQGRGKCLGQNRGILCRECDAGYSWNFIAPGQRECHKCLDTSILFGLLAATFAIVAIVLYILDQAALAAVAEPLSIPYPMLRSTIHYIHMLSCAFEASRIDAMRPYGYFLLPFDVFWRPLNLVMLDCSFPSWFMRAKISLSMFAMPAGLLLICAVQIFSYFSQVIYLCMARYCSVCGICLYHMARKSRKAVEDTGQTASQIDVQDVAILIQKASMDAQRNRRAIVDVVTRGADTGLAAVQDLMDQTAGIANQVLGGDDAALDVEEEDDEDENAADGSDEKNATSDNTWRQTVAKAVLMQQKFRINSHLRSFFRQSILWIMITYPPAVRQFTEVQTCVEIDGRRYLKLNHDITCDSDRYISSTAHGNEELIMFFTMHGVPFVLLVVLICVRSELWNMSIRESFGVLYLGFTPGCFFWEPLHFWRIWGLIFCSMIEDLTMRLRYMAFIIFVSLFLLCYIQPDHSGFRAAVRSYNFAAHVGVILVLMAGVVCQEANELEQEVESLPVLPENAKMVFLAFTYIMQTAVFCYGLHATVLNGWAVDIASVIESASYVNPHTNLFLRFLRLCRGVNPVYYFRKGEADSHVIDVSHLDKEERRSVFQTLSELFGACIDSTDRDLHTLLLETAIREVFVRAMQTRTAKIRAFYEQWGTNVTMRPLLFAGNSVAEFLCRCFSIAMRPPDLDPGREELQLDRGKSKFDDLKHVEEANSCGVTVAELGVAMQEVSADIMALHPLLHRSHRMDQKAKELSDEPRPKRSVQKWEVAAGPNFLNGVANDKASKTHTPNENDGKEDADPDDLLRQLREDYDRAGDEEQRRLIEACQELEKELEDLKQTMRANRQNVYAVLSEMHEPTKVSLKWGVVVNKLLNATTGNAQDALDASQASVDNLPLRAPVQAPLNSAGSAIANEDE